MNKTQGFQRLRRAWGFSWQGLRACYAQEAAFRQEVWLLIPLVPLGLWLGESPAERALLVGSLLWVPLVELLNSALEACVDRMGSERHVLAGRAKDLASAAVLWAIALALILWGLILLPKWF